MWLLLYILHWFEMPFVHIDLAFTLQVAFQGMSKVLTLMLALSPRLARLFYLHKCLPFLCYTLVLSLLLLKVSFRPNLLSFWGCLRLILHALNCFIRSLEPSRMRSGKVCTYPSIEIFKIQWTNQHGSFSSCCDVGVCTIFKEVV
jgi:hypothetical protein